MKKPIIILMLLMLIALAAIPVQAQTITMSNPGSMSERDVLLYYPNGTLQGFYNTTSVITIDPNMSYIMTLKPQSTSLIDDPEEWIKEKFSYVKTNIVAILLIMLALGALIYATRRR